MSRGQSQHIYRNDIATWIPPGTRWLPLVESTGAAPTAPGRARTPVEIPFGGLPARYVRCNVSTVCSSRVYRTGDGHDHVRRPASHRLDEPARRGRGVLGRRPVPAPRRAPRAAAELGAARHPPPARPAGRSGEIRPEPLPGARAPPPAVRRSRSSARPPAAPQSAAPRPRRPRNADAAPVATSPLLSRAFRNAG